MKLYEGMFVLDDARCSEDYNATVATVHDILTEHGAEIVDSRKWDERRLAYPIRKHQRGVYALIHFNAPPDALTPIERRLRLASDIILRHLIVVDEDGAPPSAEKEVEKEKAREPEAPQPKPEAAKGPASQADAASIATDEGPTADEDAGGTGESPAEETKDAQPEDIGFSRHSVSDGDIGDPDSTEEQREESPQDS